MLFSDDAASSPADEFDCRSADRLREIVRKKGHPVTWNRTKAQTEMRLLRKETSQDRIELVLSWLETQPENIKPGNAAWFRRNFSWLEKRAEADYIEETVVSATEQRVFDLLERLSWPEHATGYESFVRQSYANALRLYSQLGGMEEQDSTTFAAYVFTRLPDLEEFIVEWVEGVHRQIWGWDGWSGKLKLMSFKVGHRKFQEWGRKLSRDYDGSYGEWDKLMKELGYE